MWRASLVLLRDELLAREAFDTPLEAKVLIERWRQHYNTIRPHGAPGYRPPAPEARRPCAVADARAESWPGSANRWHCPGLQGQRLIEHDGRLLCPRVNHGSPSAGDLQSRRVAKSLTSAPCSLGDALKRKCGGEIGESPSAKAVTACFREGGACCKRHAGNAKEPPDDSPSFKAGADRAEFAPSAKPLREKAVSVFLVLVDDDGLGLVPGREPRIAGPPTEQ